MDYSSIVEEKAVNLSLADDLIIRAISESRKLTLGEKLFIMTSAKEGLGIPYSDRTRQMDRIIYNFLSIGVLNARELRREDKTVDLFYSDERMADTGRFAEM